PSSRGLLRGLREWRQPTAEFFCGSPPDGFALGRRGGSGAGGRAIGGGERRGGRATGGGRPGHSGTPAPRSARPAERPPRGAPASRSARLAERPPCGVPALRSARLAECPPRGAPAAPAAPRLRPAHRADPHRPLSSVVSWPAPPVALDDVVPCPHRMATVA